MSTLSIPVTLVAGTNENVNDVVTNFNAIASWANGNVGSTNIATSGVATTNIAPLAVTDAKIASANNSVYKRLVTNQAVIAGATTGATIFLFSWGGAAMGTSGANSTSFTPFSLLGSDFTVGSLTTKVRVRALATCNATAPLCTLAVGLYPVTVAGGAGTNTVTAGTLVTSSAATLAAPAASTATPALGSDVTIPSDGAYALGVVVSGVNQAANSSIILQAHLDIRHT